MSKFERCVLRVGHHVWIQDWDGSCRDMGNMTPDEAIALSIRCQIPIRVAHQKSQGAFARDVAAERFGLKRGGLGLWFIPALLVEVWARY